MGEASVMLRRVGPERTSGLKKMRRKALMDLADQLRNAGAGAHGVVAIQTNPNILHALEHFAGSREALPTRMQPHPAVIPARWSISTEDVMQALEIDKRGYAAIVAALAARRGGIVSKADVAHASGYAVESLQVIICNVRRELKDRMIPVRICTLRGKGFYIPLEDVAGLKRKILFSAKTSTPLSSQMDFMCQALKIDDIFRDLFMLFASRLDMIISYDQISELSGWSSGTMRTNISRLRSNLAAAGFDLLLENISTVGYRMRRGQYEHMCQALDRA